MRCIATFDVTSMALMFEKACRAEGLSVRVIPVPRQISASCGLACSWPCDKESDVKDVCSRYQIDVASWHELED